MMSQQSRKIDDESQKAIDEFLANGGKIQHFKFGERTENVNYTGGFYGKKHKAQDEKADEE